MLRARHMQAWPGWLLALVVWRCDLGSAERLQGELPRTSDYAEFVGKFVYDYSPDQEQLIGEIGFSIVRENPVGEAPSKGKLYFMIFDDERKHWKRIHDRWEASTCEEKMEFASLKTEIHLSSQQATMDYIIHIKEHIRPRLWYFTFVACGIDEGLDFTYKLHAKNTLWSWQEELSLDHVGMTHVFFISSVAFTLATLATAWVARWREGAECLREHPYTQLLLLSYIASSASCVFFMAHYMLFIHDGFGNIRIRFLACLGSIVANCTIYLIAILSSIGWAISRGPLPSRHLFLGLITLLGAVHAYCELRSELTIDTSSKLYAYSTPEGTLNMILKIFMFCWFAHHCKTSYDLEQNSKQREFYKWLGLSLSVWSINVPVTVIMANSLAPWLRFRVVTTTDIACRLFGQVMLSRLFCGPLSPISAANTFRARLEPYVDLGGGHDNL